MDAEPVYCPSCNVPMSPRRLSLRPLGRRREPDAPALEPQVRITSWHCWGCGRTRPAPSPGSARAA